MFKGCDVACAPTPRLLRYVSSMVTGMVSRFVFAFCLVNFIEDMGNLVQKHQVRSTYAAKTLD